MVSETQDRGIYAQFAWRTIRVCYCYHADTSAFAPTATMEDTAGANPCRAALSAEPASRTPSSCIASVYL